MSRYIEYEPLMAELEREVELADDWNTAHEIANVVKYAPTIDAVEVVRCKECVFGELDNRAEMYRCRSVSFPQWNKGEHFCSYGVKETDHE